MAAIGLSMRDLYERPSKAYLPQAALPVPIHAIPAVRVTATSGHDARPLEWSPIADSIWRRTIELRGTEGETYLTNRGCVVPPRDCHLRFLPQHGQHPPTLCAAITDFLTGKPLSLHFTKLAPGGAGKAGTERDKILLRGHRKSGGVIRLWPDDCVTDALGLAEGIETALAAGHAFRPVWAAVDAGNLGRLPVVNGISVLTIFGDNDDAGIRAASAIGRRWRDAGRDVRVFIPPLRGTDIVDMVNAS